MLFVCIQHREPVWYVEWGIPVLWAYKSLTWSSQCVPDHRSWPSGLAATPYRHQAVRSFQIPRPPVASFSCSASVAAPDQSHWLPQWPWVLRLVAAAAWNWYLAPPETALVSCCCPSFSDGAPQHSGRSQPPLGCPVSQWWWRTSSGQCPNPWVPRALPCAPHSQRSPPSQGSFLAHYSLYLWMVVLG